MPFAAYMSLALYHHRFGYYTAGPERSGWGGHYLTSPELDPAFGALWACGFEQVWDVCGRPAEFEIVELGPGEGGFAAAVLDAAGGPLAAALRYRLVERASSLRERQARRLPADGRVSWSRSIAEVAPIAAGIVFANEVLDNLPVHLVERGADALREVCVDLNGGALELVALPPSNDELARFLERTDVTLPVGHRMEVALAAESLARRAAGLVARGAVVFVDYGASARSLAERPDGTLLAYSADGVDGDVLRAPGERDITSHANWTSVAAALNAAGADVRGPTPQRHVLRALGAGDFDADLKRQHSEAITRGDAAGALRALSRRHALAAVTDPAGLGGLDVVAGLLGIPPPPFL